LKKKGNLKMLIFDDQKKFLRYWYGNYIYHEIISWNFEIEFNKKSGTEIKSEIKI
jgi:hypothetical protein